MRRLPLVPHVVVDDELPPSFEHVEQGHGSVAPDDCCGGVDLHHRQPPACRGHGVALARESLLAYQQLVRCFCQVSRSTTAGTGAPAVPPTPMSVGSIVVLLTCRLP
jgi:hypothetical protein